MHINEIGLGDRVKMSRLCPIDFEGIGPLPGDTGRVLALPSKNDERGMTTVNFERVHARWAIPSRYLERTD